MLKYAVAFLGRLHSLSTENHNFSHAILTEMKPFYTRLGPLLVGLSALVAADHRYVTRPELAAPRLNITVPAHAGQVAEGFLFVAPYPGFESGFSGPTQPGAYIFRDDGELVWSGVGYHAG